MASVRSLDGAIGFERRGMPGRHGRGLLAGLATYWKAFLEGSAAAHDYETLVRRGTPHEEAVARIFATHFSRR